MKVLITGVTGFAGSHLADLLVKDNSSEVWGTKRLRSDLTNLQSPVNLLDCEISDYIGVQELIKRLQPDHIYHLAAQSFVPQSWAAPVHTMETNLMGTLNLLEAVRKEKPDAKVLLAGSSEEYGMVMPYECPITEDQPLRPLSPYGVSKVAMDLLGQQFFRSYGLHVVITRAFNHTGPRRGEDFATSNFAKQIAEIEAKKRPPILQHGNLKARRDWTDVRDMVAAYRLAIEHCPPGQPYNICSGKAISVSKMLKILLSHSSAKAKLVKDRARIRPSDVALLLGNSRRFRERTGWEPQIDFEQTMMDLLNYWRERV